MDVIEQTNFQIAESKKKLSDLKRKIMEEETNLIGYILKLDEQKIALRKATDSYVDSEFEDINNKMLSCTNIECDIRRGWLTKPLLNKLTPYLRYFEEELEEINNYEQINKLQKELEEIITETEEKPIKNKQNKKIITSDSESESEEVKPKKKINKN